MSSSSFQPFHQTVLADIRTASNDTVLRVLGNLAKRTVIAENKNEIAQAFKRRSEGLGVFDTADFYRKVERKIRSSTESRRQPFHETVTKALSHITTEEQLRVLGRLIVRTRIPAGRREIRGAFACAAKRIGIANSDSNYCQEIYASLDAQRKLDTAAAA